MTRKKTTSLLGSLTPPNLPNLPIYLRNFLDAKINAKELLTIIKLYPKDNALNDKKIYH
jgi:hypothetical protein